MINLGAENNQFLAKSLGMTKPDPQIRKIRASSEANIENATGRTSVQPIQPVNTTMTFMNNDANAKVVRNELLGLEKESRNTREDSIDALIYGFATKIYRDNNYEDILEMAKLRIEYLRKLEDLEKKGK